MAAIHQRAKSLEMSVGRFSPGVGHTSNRFAKISYEVNSGLGYLIVIGALDEGGFRIAARLATLLLDAELAAGGV